METNEGIRTLWRWLFDDFYYYDTRINVMRLSLSLNPIVLRRVEVFIFDGHKPYRVEAIRRRALHLRKKRMIRDNTIPSIAAMMELYSILEREDLLKKVEIIPPRPTGCATGQRRAKE